MLFMIPLVAIAMTPPSTDRLAPLSPSAVHLDGYLSPRIDANTRRLLAVDLEPLLAGFRHKPGSHPWIGEHIGKWMHAATLAWANSRDTTLKKKLDVDFRPYVILGACNPGFAYKALQAEDKIGTMLPCNVILQETGKGRVEVSAVDPIASMQGVDNPGLAPIAGEVRQLLKQAVDGL